MMPEVLAFLEEKIGPYPYPALNVVGSYITAGGMEYPHLVYINNIYSSPREIAVVVIHEVIHQWFYGLLANNQTRYGWMDEGFTSFFEIWCTEHLWGAEHNLDQPGKGLQQFFAPHSDSRRQSFLNYAELALSGKEEPIDQQFDYFRGDPYTPTYDKMSVVLFTLKSILGDSLFTRCIRDYYRRWRFRHPSPQALFRSFERTSGLELEWFWEPFLRTTWQCDYALAEIAPVRDDNPFEKQAGYRFRLRLEKKQPLPLPLEIELELSDRSRRRYLVPVSAASPAYPGKAGVQQLRPWHPAHRYYETQLTVPLKVRRVQLDPDHKLPDLNRFNDDSRFWPRVRWSWLRKQYYNPRGDVYPVTLAPFIFYSDPDGVQLGLQSRGEYLAGQYRHYARVMMGIRQLLPDAWLEWQHRLSPDRPRLQYRLRGAHSGGRLLAEAALIRRYGYARRWEVGYRFFKRTDSGYLPENAWQEGAEGEIFLKAQIGGGQISRFWRWEPLRVSATTSTVGSDADFRQLLLTTRHNLNLPLLPNFQLLLRGGASRGELPRQRRFRIGQANPFQQFWNLYARSAGTIPVQWRRKGRFMVPGGGDVRGALSENSAAAGGSGLLAGELRTPLPDLSYRLRRLPPLADLRFSLYTAWAQVWDGRGFRWERFWGEAGISLHYPYPPLVLRYLHISGIHVDFPVWLKRPGSNPDPWAFRWVLRLDVERFYR